MSSSIETAPSAFASTAGQSLGGRISRAMFTARMSSSIVTSPSPLQSPAHAAPPTVTDTVPRFEFVEPSQAA